MPTAYDRLIDSLFAADPASRAFAHSFVQHFQVSPFADRIIPAMLQEGAQVNARVAAGELTPQAGRDLLMSMASEAYGLPPHIVQDGQAWLTDMVAQSGGEDGATEPQGDVSGPRAALINKLFAPQDRAAAAAFAQALDADPRSASRTEALLHEIARAPSDMSPEQSYAYIADFARSIGIPEHLVTSALDAIGAPAQAAHEAQVLHDLVGDLAPQAQHAQRVAEREAAQKDVAKYEAMMRAPQGSPEWRAYWQEGGAAAYRDALELSLVEPPAAPADAGLPEAPAAAPVPAPTAPAAP